MTDETIDYTIERLHDPNALFVRITPTFTASKSLKPYYEEMIIWLDKEPTPIETIIDMTNAHIVFNELLAATKAMQGIGNDPNQHRNNIGFILITDSRMMKLAMEGLHKLGIVRQVQVVNSLDDALALIKVS